MSIDRARVQRFDPATFPESPQIQWLYRESALLPECEWNWKAAAVDLETGTQAYIFGSHAAAEIQAAKMPYCLPGASRDSIPFAVVCGSAQCVEERHRRANTRAAHLDAIEADELRTPSLPADEVFRRTEARNPT